MGGMTKQTYVRYWGGLVVYMKGRGYLAGDWDRAISDSTRQRVFGFPGLGDELRISAGASPGLASESPYIQVDLTANPNPHAKSIFLSLYGRRGPINAEIGSDPPPKWDVRSDAEESWARARKYAVPEEERDWENQYEWLAKTLVAFNEAIRKRL